MLLKRNCGAPLLGWAKYIIILFLKLMCIDLITDLEAILMGRRACLEIKVFVWKSDVK